MLKLTKKKIPAKEFIMKLREAVVNIVRITRELQANVTEIQERLTRLEKSIQNLDSRIKRIEDNILPTTTPPVAKEPEVEIPAVEGEAEILEEPEFIELAKELGVELTESKKSPGEIPTPPPVPPIEGPREMRKLEKEEKSRVDLGILRRGEEAKTEELKKEKDELLKALEELDII